MTTMTAFGIELTQQQIDFIKARFNLTSNGQVRLWLENRVRSRLNRMQERYYATNNKK